jgi:homoserine O-succinyltransferase
MPDAAFDATERQYLGLIESFIDPGVLVVRRYTAIGVPRAGETARRIRDEYFPWDHLYLEPPDVLIVTGSNPVEPRIEDENYWADLRALLTWARGNVPSTLLSCLAAHAALAVYDGIERVRLPTKCTGVFSQHVERGHSLTDGLENEIRLPHSRWNTVPQGALERAGYCVLIHAEASGWSVASRQEDGCQTLLVQGHPEYDPSSLLREYRRDAGRYVRREREDVPVLPRNCVAPEDQERLEHFHGLIVGGERDPVIFDTFPFDEVGARAPWTWRNAASRFYANWLTSVDPRED